MLMRGFIYARHYSYSSELFNHTSQSGRLGITSTGAYIFSHNVVPKGTEANQPKLLLTPSVEQLILKFSDQNILLVFQGDDWCRVIDCIWFLIYVFTVERF